MAQSRLLRWTTTACKHFRGYDVNTTTSNTASLYMVPGAPAPLARIYVGGNNLLLSYADDRARLWDVKTLEFWRSMDLEKTKDQLAQGGWTELFVARSCALCVVPTLTLRAGLSAIRLQWETYQLRSRFLRLILVCFVTPLTPGMSRN
jgi:hypothetical protein